LPIAEEALKRIGELYKLEAEITGQPAEARRAARQHRAVAILDALHEWLVIQRRRLSSKNALARAIQYALTRWQALTRYAGADRLKIDNNVAERALRTIAITRKNFLFLGSEAGGARAALYGAGERQAQRPRSGRTGICGSSLHPRSRAHRQQPCRQADCWDLLRPRLTKLDYVYDMGDLLEYQLTLSKPRAADPALRNLCKSRLLSV
jgi:Transposase IS66 family